MNKKILVLLINLVSTTLFAQNFNFDWAISEGGITTDFGRGITVDTSGNVYVVGTFQDTSDFDPGLGVFNLISNGSTDIFIQKIDSNGNLIWAESIGGTSFDVAYSITIDAFQNIYVTGNYQNTVDFNPNAGTFNMTAAGTYDIFILKLNSNGSFIWAKPVAGSIVELSRSITIDRHGYLYLTGEYYGTVDFDTSPTIYNLTSTGNRDIFIEKLDSSGNFIWVKSMGGTLEDVGYNITTDYLCNIYTTGHFEEIADFDPSASTFNLTSNGEYDIFIQKLDSNGNFIWANSMGSTVRDIGLSTTISTTGSIYTTGFYQDTVDFDSGSATFNLTSAGNYDAFIQKLDANGDFIWAQSMGGPSVDNPWSITTDTFGNVYTIGEFYGVSDYDPSSVSFNLTSNGGGDVFIQKLDSNGSFIWAKSMGGTSQDVGISIIIDTKNNIYITGGQSGMADFDPSPTIYNLNSNGGSDVFVEKFSQPSVINYIPERILFDNLSIYPNPASEKLTIVSNQTINELTIIDITGKVIITTKQNTNVVNVAGLSNGIYFIKLIAEGKTLTKKFVKQ